LRLVPVDLEPTAPAVTAPAWEVATARGDVLRVYRAVAPIEIRAALSALLARGGRR
jgi:hypothetical protein